MMNGIIAFIFLLIPSCSNRKAIEIHKLKVKIANKEQLFTIKLKKKYYYQQMQITENTLDDTCMIGLIKIAPGKTGLLYRVEFNSDSISYSYFTYRAHSGELTIEHEFFDE